MIIKDKAIAVKSITKRVENVHPLIVIPKAVPAAGGCSVLVITIIKIANPTENAGMIIFNILPELKKIICKSHHSQ